MSNSNYPAGVTDSHPHFNPAPVSASAVECGADSALVVPSFAVKGELNRLQDDAKRYARNADNSRDEDRFLALAANMATLIKMIDELEQETEYECPFNDEIDLEESECARWDCPVCGNERETDTMPEDRDPDYEHDHMGEGR